MARTAQREVSGAPNVIDLARARVAQRARRSMFRWPTDGPHPERVAAAALAATAGEAALVAADGTVLAVNRRWSFAAPQCLPGTDFFSSWRLHELDPRDAGQLITGVRGSLTATEGYVHEFQLADHWSSLEVTPLGGPVGGAVITVDRLVDGADGGDGREPGTGLAEREAGGDVAPGCLTAPAVPTESMTSGHAGFPPVPTAQVARSRADEARMITRQKDPTDG